MTVVPEFVVYNPREGQIPTAARLPWTTFGSPSSSVGSGPQEWWLDFTTSGSPAGYVKLFPLEIAAAEDIEIQATGQRVSGSGSMILAISDSQKLVGLAIGSSVALVSFTGSFSQTIIASWDPTIPHSYALRKEGTRRWSVWIDGRLVGWAPYTATDMDADLAARVMFGGTGTQVGRWYIVEGGLDDAAPPAWKVQKARNTLPPARSAVYLDTIMPDAVNRTLLGWFESGERAMTDYIGSRTSGLGVLGRWEGSGAALPGVGNTLTEIAGGAGPAITVVRERLRFLASSTSGYRIVGKEWSSTFVNVPDAHIFVAGTVTIREVVASGVSNRTGVVFGIFEDYGISMQIKYTPGSDVYEVGLITAISEFPGVVVNAELAHRIELHLFMGYGALLIIDGLLAYFLPWSLIALVGNVTSAHVAYAGHTTSVTVQSTVDMEDIVVQVGVHDGGRRPALELRSLETNVPIGGWDRNDELETVLRNRFGVHGDRGTHHGIVFELQRLTFAQVFWYDDEAPRGWYLNRSWPGVTPVYLNSPGTNVSRTYTISTSCKLLTPLELAQWAAFNLLPRSVGSRRFAIALRLVTTGAFSAGAASFSTDPKVPLTISVGDKVTIRTPSGTNPSVRTVTAISSSSITLSPAPSGSLYTTGSIVLRTLARS